MINEFEIEINDMPCTVRVWHYYKQPPCPTTWDSDMDYYGYTEFDYSVYNDIGAEIDVSEADDVRILAKFEEEMDNE